MDACMHAHTRMYKQQTMHDHRPIRIGKTDKYTDIAYKLTYIDTTHTHIHTCVYTGIDKHPYTHAHINMTHTHVSTYTRTHTHRHTSTKTQYTHSHTRTNAHIRTYQQQSQ